MIPRAASPDRGRTQSRAARPSALSRTRRPEGMSLEAWQTALRRDFGRSQRFRLQNTGPEPVFSEFTVTNPQTKGTYRVAIRGRNPGDNYCSCPDFSVNTLGTCKHIEFTLARLEKQRGGRAALAAGFQPDYSEVFLRYGAKREVAFRPGHRCPPAVRSLASRYFDPDGRLKPLAYDRFESFLKDARSDGHELRCYEDALTFIAQVRDGTRRHETVNALFPRGATSPAFEKLLKVPLYPYQRQGALFAATAGRCLLADDMGLGKTIQPAPMPRETAESRAEASQGQQEARAADEPGGNGKPARAEKPEAPTQGLADLLTAGLSFLDTLGKTLAAGQAATPGGTGREVLADSFIGRDEKTGQAYLKLPVPTGETFQKIADALGALAQAFRPGS
ncbi:MAG TPA: hypothetical protein VLT62_06795 [Candidatus Methylomirabilis sp.]|nr:hypothetical protein [Candidatus Methylomirabilis sp.]